MSEFLNKPPVLSKDQCKTLSIWKCMCHFFGYFTFLLDAWELCLHCSIGFNLKWESLSFLKHPYLFLLRVVNT